MHVLNDRIHEFHQGPSRKLWSRYSQGEHYFAAVGAILAGIVAEHEVAEDVMQILRPDLAARRE